MIGQRLAERYEILEKLGAGGMGVVYRAHDPVLTRDVAVKVVPPWRLDDDADESFQREARLVAQLDHPGIVPIHDLGRHEGALFFVMPLLAGTTLRQLVEEHRLTAEDSVTIAIAVAEALDHSHRRGILHRDVKPENVMVTRRAGKLRVRVMDFGLARQVGEARRSGTGTVGTPVYLSPEQIAGSRLDGRTDVYSLGVTLYECLAGVAPFEGAVPSLLYRIAHEAPPAFARHGVDVDPGLEQIVLRCLAKDPAARPAARELAAALVRWTERTAAPSEEEPAEGRPGTGAVLPMVGRDEEWGRLLRRWHEASSGDSRMVLVGGEAGVGKSRLLQELEEVVDKDGGLVLFGRFSDLEGSLPYEGLCALVQDFFRREPADGLDLADLAPELVEIFPILSEVPELRRDRGLVQGSPPGAALPGPISAGGPSHVFELLARTFVRLAGGRPLALLVENLHEADASIEALKYLVHRLGPTPTLIVGTYRPTQAGRGHPLRRLLRGGPDDRRTSSFLLEPLGRPGLDHLVTLLVGGGRLSDELVERLDETTEGNPLFLRELIRSLLESGGLTRGPSGVWELSGEAALAVHDLPLTLQQAVERRLDRLPRADRGILAIAAVLGKSFTYDDLEALADDPGELDPAIERLVAQGLLREDRASRDDRLHFTSGLVRTVLYRRLPRRRRRAIHRRYAAHLEDELARRDDGHLERLAPVLAYHFSAADDAAKTVTYALHQARHSLAAWSPEDALRAIRPALELVDEDEVDEPRLRTGELREIEARACRILGQNARALEAASRAADAYRAAGVPARAAAAALVAARAAWQGRQVEDTRLWVDRGLELAAGLDHGETGVVEVLKRLYALGSTIANLRGEPRLAHRYRLEAEALETSPAPSGGAAGDLPRGGVLRTSLPLTISRLDPAEISSDEMAEVALIVFEPLLSLDEEGHLVPVLAEDWESSQGGLRLDLVLRPGLTFSDGEPLTARDVKASLERLARRAIEAPVAALMAIVGHDDFVAGRSPEIAGIEVLEPDGGGPSRRLAFHLGEPLPIFPALFTDPYTAIVAERGGQQGGELRGSGPFRVASHDGGRLDLERNPFYRGTPPLLDGISFALGSNGHEIARGLVTGDLDLGRDLPPRDLDEVLRDPRFRSGLVEATSKNVYFLLFNLDGPLARRPELRRALNGLVRTSELVWRTLGRFAQPASSLVPPGVLGHDPGRRRRLLTPEEARAILREAGLLTPLRLRAAAHPVLFDRGANLLEAVFSAWKEIGVEVSLERTSIKDFLDVYHQSADVDLLFARWNADYYDPDSYTFCLFHSRHGVFRRYFSSPEADRLLDRARHEARSGARQALYRRFEELLERQDAVLPLFHDIAYRIAGPRLLGMRLRNSLPYVNYGELARDEVEPAKTCQRGSGQRGGQLDLATLQPVTSLDPVGGGFVEHFEVSAAIFEGLTRLDEAAGVVPWLAASIETQGGQTYRFRLREDVRFHDGRRLRSRDVRASFERVLRGSSHHYHTLFLPIRGARAFADGEAEEVAGIRLLSASELEIELEEPLAFFPSLLSSPAVAVVPESGVVFDGSWRDGCVGTGPFRVVSFEPGERLELERNPFYWRPGVPRSERLTFHFGLSPAEIAAGFRRGHLSLAGDLKPADVLALRGDSELAPGYFEAPRLSTLFLALNTRRGPLADRRRRRALARALRVDTLVAAEERLQRAHGLIPPGLVGYEVPRRRDETSATRDVPLSGLELVIGALPVYSGPYASFSQELRESLRRLGIEAAWREVQPDRLVTMVRRGELDVACYRWVADYPDPDAFVYLLLHSSAGTLSGFCGSPEVDRLCARGRRETDSALRHALYRELEAWLEREAWLVPLFHEQSYRFVQPGLDGVRMSFAVPEVRTEDIGPRRDPDDGEP